jgi:hypothetical protein
MTLKDKLLSLGGRFFFQENYLPKAIEDYIIEHGVLYSVNKNQVNSNLIKSNEVFVKYIPMKGDCYDNSFFLAKDPTLTQMFGFTLFLGEWWNHGWLIQKETHDPILLVDTISPRFNLYFGVPMSAIQDISIVETLKGMQKGITKSNKFLGI